MDTHNTMDTNKLTDQDLMTQFSETKSHSSAKWLLALLVVVIGIGLIYFFGGDLLGFNIPRGVEKNGYQAVFLSNNQVYFGKLRKSGEDYVLSDIYYIQVGQIQPREESQPVGKNQPPQPTPSPNVQLIKLGSEIHGPKDGMYIQHDKIFFWENLRPDSKIVTGIQSFEKK